MNIAYLDLKDDFPAVIPTQAGIQVFNAEERHWIPACAGMTAS